MSGSVIVRLDAVGTAVFCASAVAAAAIFDGFAQIQGVVVSLVLFVAGVLAFLLGYWRAIQRSRRDVMAVTELFFMVGPFIDRRVARVMNGLLTAQVLVGVATALYRSSTVGSDGVSTPGSTLAFGILAPMFGLGLNGLWSSMHGRFPPRSDSEANRSARDGRSSDTMPDPQ